MHSPLVERIKHNVGLEYEYVLQEMLENLKVRLRTLRTRTRTCLTLLFTPRAYFINTVPARGWVGVSGAARCIWGRHRRAGETDG